MPHEVIMPALGMAQDTGVLVAWYKAPGDAVKAMDVLMEVETDKSTMEVEAGFDGYVTELRVAAGDEAPVGDVIAVISDSPDDAQTGPQPVGEGASKADADAPSDAASDAPGDAPQAASAPQPAEPEAATSKPDAAEPATDAPAAAPVSGAASAPGSAPISAPISAQTDRMNADRILASPKAKRLAHERGLDLRSLVQRGIPQPYHVADLEQAQPAAGAASDTSVGRAPDRAHLSARVGRQAFQQFLDWAGQETGTPPDAAALWASFAAGALRRATARCRAPLQIRVTRAGPGRATRVYQDPDRPRLGALQPQEDGDGAAPDLILRDLSATRVDMVRLPDDGAAPLLTVCRGDGDTLALALEFTPGALDPDAAVSFLDDLARRAETPLRHLL